MAQKRQMWYLDMALDPSGPARVIPNMPIAFPEVNFTYNPNFSHLGVPHGLEEGPVALGPGPGPLCHGEVLVRVQAHLDHGDKVQGPLGHGVKVLREQRQVQVHHPEI